MNRKRCTTPPASGKQTLLPTPSTPGPANDALPRIMIPPSPGDPYTDTLATSSGRSARLRATPARSKRSQTVGVIKTVARARKAKINFLTTLSTAVDEKKTVGFMDLPGEIRNLIYSFTSQNPRQALLVHRPRIASLRPRTRLDRQRTLASDLVQNAQDDALPATNCRSRTRVSKRKQKTVLLARESNRPFFGLTQVCRLLRQEFRPIYMQRQEIGMDLVEVVPYLRTFYSEAPALLKNLPTSHDRKVDMPFTGNLTIAVSDKVKEVEKAADGVDVWPLLDLWANSYKIEAGFGRYMQLYYDATADGEAKDLYRLFGRRVQADRRCSSMNTIWRGILRTRSLAAIRIHRRPSSTSLTPASAEQRARLFVPVVPDPKPYIHILFRSDTAEAWMTKEESTIPPGWLDSRGFGRMEYFDVKVGIISESGG